MNVWKQSGKSCCAGTRSAHTSPSRRHWSSSRRGFSSVFNDYF